VCLVCLTLTHLVHVNTCSSLQVVVALEGPAPDLPLNLTLPTHHQLPNQQQLLGEAQQNHTCLKLAACNLEIEGSLPRVLYKRCASLALPTYTHAHTHTHIHTHTHSLTHTHTHIHTHTHTRAGSCLSTLQIHTHSHTRTHTHTHTRKHTNRDAHIHTRITHRAFRLWSADQQRQGQLCCGRSCAGVTGISLCPHNLPAVCTSPSSSAGVMTLC